MACLQLITDGLDGDGTSMIGNQPLAHADALIVAEADGFVECEHGIIALSHLQVDLGAVQRQQSGFGFLHQLASESLATILGGYGKVVDPAAMAFITGHDRAMNRVAGFGNQKQIVLYRQFALDIPCRIVPGAHQATVLPECDDAFAVSTCKASNVHAGGLSLSTFQGRCDLEGYHQ